MQGQQCWGLEPHGPECPPRKPARRGTGKITEKGKKGKYTEKDEGSRKDREEIERKGRKGKGGTHWHGEGNQGAPVPPGDGTEWGAPPPHAQIGGAIARHSR